MKRSEMVLNIASELVHEYTDFMSFDKAQKLAEIVLNRIEKEAMFPPPIKNPKFQGGHNNTIHPYYINEWDKE